MAEDFFDQAPSVGGLFNRPNPRGAIVHSLECEARRGLARALAAGYIKNAGVSPHRMTDPGETVGVCHLDRQGFHVGGPGNQFLVGKEVTGRATWTLAQWLEAEAFEAVRQDAKDMADLWREMGWAKADMRWGSLAELRDALAGYRGGYATPPRMWTHNDVSETVGGTNHWDPGPNFPYATFQKMCHQFYDGTTGPGTTPDPGNTDPANPGPGGAQDPTPKDGNMFWMHAVGRPIVCVVGGKAFDLTGLDYEAVKARLIVANVPEHNFGNEVGLYDRILQRTSK